MHDCDMQSKRPEETLLVYTWLKKRLAAYQVLNYQIKNCLQNAQHD